MPIARVQLPDGRIGRFEVPEGTTPEQVLAYAEGGLSAEPKAEPRSSLQEFGRQTGLAGRYLAEGAAGLAGIVADPIGATLGAATGQPYQPLQQYVGDSLTRLGVPEPETGLERVVGGAGRALVGGGGFVGAGRAMAQQAPGIVNRIGGSLSSMPGTQAASAVSGGGAVETVRERGGSPIQQALAGVGAALVPAVGMTAGPMAVRAGFRGGEAGRQTVEGNIEKFRGLGTSPSVGQATEGRFGRSLETLLSRLPGGAGKVLNKAETQADEIGSGVERIANRLSSASSPEKSGMAVQRGIRGDDGFVERFKAQQGRLYDELDKHVPPQQQIKVEATRKALDALNADIPGAPNLSQWFKNARISGIRGALVKDTEGTESLLTRQDIPDAFKQMVKNQEGADLAYTLRNIQDGTLPYEAVKKLRTLVGNEMADAGLASDVPRSKWKALYAALSDDLGGAVKGDKLAEAAWNRANNFTRSGMKRLDVIDDVVSRKGGPEAVFKAVVSGTKEGATVLRSVMQSIPKDAQKQLVSTVVRRLGKANPANQDDVGGVFSTERFLTNWNNISPEAKRAMFDRFGSQFRNDMDRVAQVSANLRDGSKVFSNPSGTSQGVAQSSTAAAAIVTFLTGQWGALGAIAGSVGSANLAARLMVKPEFVSWLAKSSRVPFSALNQQAIVLDNIAKRTGDEDMAELAGALKKSSQKQTGQRAR